MADVSDIGTTLLTSLTGSSFDIGNMSKVMADADVAGPRNIVERGQEKNNVQLDALKYLETNLTAFKTYLTDLSSPELFGTKTATSSADSVVSVIASNDTAIANYQIESRQLAQAHTLVGNQSYSSPSDTIASGNFDITIAGNTQTIPIDATNNTLEGLQKIINNGDYGVTASIINNSGSYQMMFSSKESGSASEMTLSGSDFNPANMTTTSNGQDAVMVLNGLTVTSSTNKFENVVEGLEFHLNSVDIGNPKTVTVGRDSQAVTDTITSFVDVYNQMTTILDELGKYDKSDLTEAEIESDEFEFYGDLAGSSMLRSVKADIKESLSGAISEISGNINSLGVVGISFDRKGVLELDSAKLQGVIDSDMDAISNLFSKGGYSTDPLINFTDGSSKTVAGNYELNITQLAERATVSGGATVATTDERLAGSKVSDSASYLTIGSGTSFDFSLNGAAAQSISLTAGSYATKADMTAAIQSQIDSVVGANKVAFEFDSTQSRFELSAAVGQGSVDMTSVSGLSNQGFSAASYAGEGLIDLAADATFDAVVDQSTLSTITIASGRYTATELAERMATNINSNTEVKSDSANVSVRVNGGALEISSSKFGVFSKLEFTNFSGFGNAGFADASSSTDTGLNVDGTITTDAGTLNLGAYATSEDGRKISVSDFAVIGGEAADVRGLQFEVLGGAIGNRGNISFAQGFASKLSDTISNFFDEDSGLISQKITTLTNKNEDYDERSKKLDLRYEKQELKYKMQFAALQSIMSNSQATRDQLSAQFSPS